MKKLFLGLFVLMTGGANHAQSVGIGTNNPSGIFHVTNNPSGTNALFYVSSNGNVGVGTINPQDKLDVAGRIMAKNATITRTSPGTHPFAVESYLSLIDQQQNTGNTISATPLSGWQTFTAGVTGTLDSVVLSFLDPGGLQGARTLTILSGDGWIGTPLISAAVHPIANSPLVSSYLNVHIIAGNKYTIMLDFQYGWAYSPANVYAGGNADNFISGDRCFKIYVTSLMSFLKVDNTGNIGIGTNNPSEKLVVSTANDNYGLIHTNGDVSLGTFVGGGSIYGGWVGTKSNHPLLFFTNNGSSQMAVMPNGNVGIGTVSPNYKLQVSGLVAANDFVNMSDARLKKDIVPVSDALSSVLRLNAVTYYWKKESYPQFQFDNKHKIGFLAQEVEKVMPELVAIGADGYKTVNYIEVVPLLVESIKEQQQQINELKQLIRQLTAAKQ